MVRPLGQGVRPLPAHRFCRCTHGLQVRHPRPRASPTARLLGPWPPAPRSRGVSGCGPRCAQAPARPAPHAVCIPSLPPLPSPRPPPGSTARTERPRRRGPCARPHPPCPAALLFRRPARLPTLLLSGSTGCLHCGALCPRGLHGGNPGSVCDPVGPWPASISVTFP